MCRRNQLLGFVLIAFGAGLILGCWLSSEFLGYCVGIGAAAMGLMVLNKK